MSLKIYEVEEFRFEFIPQGDPYKGVLSVTDKDHGTYSAEITLTKLASRNAYANEAGELYKMDSTKLKRALNEICTRRLEEVAAAAQASEDAEQPEPEPLSEEAERLVATSGVLNRFVETATHIQDVVKDRGALNSQAADPRDDGRPA
jgi:hypothetical protein